MLDINLGTICSEVGIGNSALLITREKGQKVYIELVKHIQASDPANCPIRIIFPENQLMDVSFADEVVIRLQEGLNKDAFGEGQGIILYGLGDDSIENLTAAVKLQKLKIAFMVIKQTGQWDCIGQLEQNLRETLDLLFKQGQLTAPDLARQLGLAVNTASTRLKRLYDMHLIRRDFEITENGLQYIYMFWPLEESKHD
ncbi:MAG: winged helix-turn-helix transcriptional regulator [Anaerolineales bacterium]|jgi:DNA-binding transcriptional ArsR family regulator|nr:winged helix-turn-helix transcriptional regulator [Anaerolineales bacterium]